MRTIKELEQLIKQRTKVLIDSGFSWHYVERDFQIAKYRTEIKQIQDQQAGVELEELREITKLLDSHREGSESNIEVIEQLISLAWS